MKNTFESPALKTTRALNNSPVMRAIRAMENSPSIKIIRKLNESPAIKAMHQFENSTAMQAIREFEESSAIQIIRELKNSPALRTIKGLEKSSVFKAIQKLQEPPALRVLHALKTSPAMEAFLRVTEQINHGYGAMAFSEAYELLANEYKKQSDPKNLDVLSEEIQKRVGRAPLGALSAEFYLNLILALFLFYLSQISAQESEGKILERMNDLEQTITNQLNESNQLEKNQLFLVADRSLNLRSGPGMDHDVIGNISRNQKLIELERDHDWVKVEYFDHINNINVAGWAHNQYLLAITPKQTGLESNCF